MKCDTRGTFNVVYTFPVSVCRNYARVKGRRKLVLMVFVVTECEEKLQLHSFQIINSTKGLYLKVMLD